MLYDDRPSASEGRWCIVHHGQFSTVKFRANEVQYNCIFDK